MDKIYWHSYDEYSEDGSDYNNWTYDQDGYNRISYSDISNHILSFEGYGTGSGVNCTLNSMNIGGLYIPNEYGHSNTITLTGNITIVDNSQTAYFDIYDQGYSYRVVFSYLYLIVDSYTTANINISTQDVDPIYELRLKYNSVTTFSNFLLATTFYFDGDCQLNNVGNGWLYLNVSQNRVTNFQGSSYATCTIGGYSRFTLIGGLYDITTTFNDYGDGNNSLPTIIFNYKNEVNPNNSYLAIIYNNLSGTDSTYFTNNSNTIPLNLDQSKFQFVNINNSSEFDLDWTLPNTYNTSRGLSFDVIPDAGNTANIVIPNNVSYLTGVSTQIPYGDNAIVNMTFGDNIVVNGNMGFVTYVNNNSHINTTFGNNVSMIGGSTLFRLGSGGTVSGTYGITINSNLNGSYYRDPTPPINHTFVNIAPNNTLVVNTNLNCTAMFVSGGGILRQINSTSISASNLNFQGSTWNCSPTGSFANFVGLTSNVTVAPGASVQHIDASDGYEVYAIGATDLGGNLNFRFGNLFTAPPTRPFLVRVSAIPSTDNSASLQIPQGVTPTNIENGDTWVTSGGAFMQINGEVKNLDNTWGTISGDISAQSDLYTSINSKVNNTTLSSITGNFQYQINTLSINSVGVSSTNDNVGVVWDGVIGNGYGIYAFYEKQVTNRWAKVGYGNKTFIAVANSHPSEGENNQLAMKSTTGKTWSIVNTPTSLYYPSMNDIVYGDGTFLVGGYSYGNNGFIMRSTDNGDSWTDSTTPTISSNSSVVSLSYGNGAFVGVVINGISNSKIIRSTDSGVNWTQIGSNPVNFYSSAGAGISFGNGRFVAVGGDINGNGLVMSSDTSGSTWTNAVTISGSGILKDVAYGDNKFVAISNENIVISYDYGLNWEIVKSLPHTGMTITYGNGMFIYTDYLGSSSSSIYASRDGTLYTNSRKSSDMFRTTSPFATCYGNGLFVTVTGQLGENYFDDRLLTSGEVYDTNIGSTYPVFSNLYSSGIISAEKGVTINNSESLPSTIGAATMFVSGGALYFKGSLGTVTKIANA